MPNRRNTKRYKENPWLEKAALQTVLGTRVITAQGDNDRKLIISKGTGEIQGLTGFYTRIKTDKTHFLKVYADGVRALTGLSTAGMKIFILVYDKITSNEGFGKDTIMLNYDMLTNEQQEQFSLRTFQRGISDLIDHDFLAETMQTGVYFVNPTFIFNGDRLALVKEYVLTDTRKKSKQLVNPELTKLPST